MYERILEAIQQLREQGVRPSKIKMTPDCYYKCEARTGEIITSMQKYIINDISNMSTTSIYGLKIEIDDTIDDFEII